MNRDLGTERVERALHRRGAQILLFLAVATMVASGFLHSNPWHLLAAGVFVLLVGVSKRMATLARWAATRGAFERRYLTRRTSFVSLVFMVCALYLPFTIMALKGDRFWAWVALPGSMVLLYIAMDALFVFRKRSIKLSLRLLALWLMVVLVESWLVHASALVITGVLLSVLLTTIFTIVDELRDIPRGWRAWEYTGLFVVWGLGELLWFL